MRNDAMYRIGLPGMRQGKIRREGNRPIEHRQRDQGIVPGAALMVVSANQVKLSSREIRLVLEAASAQILAICLAHDGRCEQLDDTIRNFGVIGYGFLECFGPYRDAPLARSSRRASIRSFPFATRSSPRGM